MKHTHTHTQNNIYALYHNLHYFFPRDEENQIVEIYFRYLF